MRPLGSIGLLVLLSSAGVVIFSTLRMAQRVEGFNEAEVSTIWHAQRTRLRQFTFRDREVRLTDAPPAENGDARLQLSYGDQSLALKVHAPIVPGMKDLKVYDEHVAALAIAANRDGAIQVDPFSDEGWRMFIVSRQTAPGWDEETWGNVRVKDWVFALYELTPEGTITLRKVQFPDRAGRVPAEVEARRKLKAAGEPVPGEEVKLTDVELIQERSLEWQAALFAIPKSQMSRYRFKTDAVRGSSEVQGMRWTLPAAAFGMMGVVGGVALMMMSATRRAARV